MPSTGDLVDRHGRVHRDLRISVTDRCNLRCVYCMPEDGLPAMPRHDLLTFDEITRLARVARRSGVTSVRITGGEPLVRRGLPGLVARLSGVGFDDLALTTNGMELAGMASELAAAGLRRVNVSCDSLRADRFSSIRRRGNLATVLGAMDAAEEAGLARSKSTSCSCVVTTMTRSLRSPTSPAARDGWSGSSSSCRSMPTEHGGGIAWSLVERCSTGSIGSGRSMPVEPGSSAPAERFRFQDGCGEVGLISSVTQPFCGTCDRLRLTADGALRNCLFSDREISVRDAVAAGRRRRGAGARLS